MQDIVASVENVTFDIEIALEQQLGAVPLPFPGMDKSGAAICIFYRRNMCMHGAACPYRHVRGDRAVVCKHWLRGLCKKGDDCEFLHEYDMTKMPECYFYQRHGECSNKECPFLHIDPESKIKDCPWYDRGFCRHGPNCKNRHVRRVLCLNYLCGFCPEGPQCKYQHPKYDLPSLDDMRKTKLYIVCHHCNEPGHKISQCPLLPDDTKIKMSIPTVSGTATSQVGSTTQPTVNGQPQMFNPRMRFIQPFVHRNLQDVTCFKCGEKGHYANKCTKGHLAFLSQKAGSVPTSEM